MKQPREIFRLLESLVAALRPPRLVIERAELADGSAILHDEKPRHLLVSAVGCLRSGFEDEVDVTERNGVGLEPSDRALGEDGLAERHRQPAVVDGRGRSIHTLDAAGIRPSLIACTSAAWSSAF